MPYYFVTDAEGGAGSVRVHVPAHWARDPFAVAEAVVRGARRLGVARGRGLWARPANVPAPSPEGRWAIYRNLGYGQGSTCVAEVRIYRQR